MMSAPVYLPPVGLMLGKASGRWTVGRPGAAPCQDPLEQCPRMPTTAADEPLLSLPCRVVVLESRPTDHPTAHSNLYILAGHENSY